MLIAEAALVVSQKAAHLGADAQHEEGDPGEGRRREVGFHLKHGDAEVCLGLSQLSELVDIETAIFPRCLAHITRQIKESSLRHVQWRCDNTNTLFRPCYADSVPTH